ncbi:MAG: pantoate--beta-alanine ligase [Eubacterium sp.]|nr:pantoate--beta-alanine ligase [Candidatus Colimonas fimequi]
MIIARTIQEVRDNVKAWRREGLTVGLCPTMGALHEGHASLVDASHAQCDKTVASIFVNPTQFAAGEDLDKYPRTFERDCEILEEHGCDMVFYPSVAEVYPEGFGIQVSITTDIVNQLCGASRPGHFAGVCTVVSKLFNIVAPDKAFFGQKDAQQLAIIRQMVRDLNFDLEIVGCPTVREADGLAKSSRNAYLSAEERGAAVILHQSMDAAQEMIDGGARSVAEIETMMKYMIQTEPMAVIDYVKIVDGTTLLPIDTVKDGDLVALAVYFGKTRLIDNFTIVI